MKFAQELPTKRERTEVFASFKLGSAGAVGRHTKTSENLIRMVSAARAAGCDHPLIERQQNAYEHQIRDPTRRPRFDAADLGSGRSGNLVRNGRTAGVALIIPAPSGAAACDQALTERKSR